MNVIPATALTLQSAPAIERAILEALIYSDIFEHPLRLDELHRYLPIRLEMDKLPFALDSLREFVRRHNDVYCLAGREELVGIRSARERRSKRLLPHALRYGKILGSLPFIRMVALTGSLAVLNVSKNADFDYMLVTARGRVWTARAFALLLNRFVRPLGHVICPNLIVSETALEWPLHDLYSARELCQMVPIAGMDVYHQLLKANGWAKKFLPNAFSEAYDPLHSVRPPIQKILEFPWPGTFGDAFEAWESARKIARFSNLPGFGEETVFTAEVCQGNFHHHRKWTRDAFEERLSALAAVPVGEWVDHQSPRTAIGAEPR